MKEISYRKQAPVKMADCGMCAATEIISDRWTLLIIREAFYGVIRFEDMLKDLCIPRAVLAARLKKLAENNILEKRQYQEEGERKRNGYWLTDKGKDLAPVFLYLMEWGDKHVRKDSSAIATFSKDSNRLLKVAIVPTDTPTYHPDNIYFDINRK